MKYSYLAETILDYATSEAKRTGTEYVSQVHLLAAIRQWNSSKFDELFPHGAAVIQNALGAIPKGSSQPVGPDLDTDRMLTSIVNAADAWKIAEDLFEVDEISQSGQDALSQGTEAKTRLHLPDEEDESPLAKIGMNNELVEEISQTLGSTFESILEEVITDVAFLTRTIHGNYSEPEAQALMTATDIALPDERIANERSGLMTRLVSHEAKSDLVAKKYALALVSVASFAASIDDEVTQDEIAQIDELRMELRAQLGSLSAHDSGAHQSSFDDAFRDIIGLESVKKELRQRIDYFVVSQRRRARGLSTAGHSMHMAFLGNPGTGKTTIARLFAKVLKEMGLLDNDNLVEVDRSGLIGEFVGHTEKKTNEVVDSALGGVLFIDEAYSLVDEYSMGKSYGDLAIDTLVKRMEDDRDRLMVVVAGYAEPMKKFLASNEGLKSRIPLELEFKDYSADELFQVAERFAMKDGFTFDSTCSERFKQAAENISKSDLCGNARDIRNLYEQSVRNQFSRVAEIGDLATTKELITLMGEDVPVVEPPQQQKTKQIGFR